ncbi:MAG TPA: CoA transferase [Solirubrobacteraceae bacterium]|jgi:crotonobetainyl-CoA:carnitine CoA-transferase CaiB-like acyl-CoA transferase
MTGPPQSGALEGMVVLELGHGIAGPFATRLLGDLGAEVLKVEQPQKGDLTRRLGPFVIDADGERTSALFELLNWNKRGIALDLHDPPDRERARDLAREADLVVTSLRPQRLRAWGLDPASLREGSPRLVVTTITDFGWDGPLSDWRGSDLVFHAMSGVAKISGTADREPLKRGGRQTLWCAGINAAYASLAGYIAARRTGVGAHVDLAIRECPASELVLNQSFYACMGAVQGRRPVVRDPLGGPLGGGDPLPAGDGYVAFQVTPTVSMTHVAELLGEPALAEERFATTEGRAANAADLIALLSARLSGEDVDELFERASRAGLLCGVVRGAAELLTCAQLRARGALEGVGGIPGLRFPARPADLSRTPFSITRRAPRLGELSAGAHPARASSAGSPPAAANAAPLSGLRVLDLSYVFAAPYVGGLLADLGAEVIKVEAPHRLDQSRTTYSPFLDNDPADAFWDRAGAFHVVNRGKRSLSLDLSTETGRRILLELVDDADVLLENFTPRVMRGWGMTYDELARRNARLVMLSNTGFGSTGPWAPFRAQGTTLEATMGLSRYAGHEDGPPSKVGQSYPDFLACWTGLLAVLAALVERERSGLGQWIDLGMYQLGAIVMPEVLLEAQLGGEEPARGPAEPDARFASVAPALGADRWLAVTAFSEEQLRALRAVVGAESKDALIDTLATWSHSRDPWEAAAVLQDAGIPAGPVLDARDMLEDPQLRARGFYETARFPDGSLRPLIGRPYRWSSEAAAVRSRGCGPRFGEAADWVLHDLLALDDEQVAAARASGAVADSPVGGATAAALDLGAMLRAGMLARVDADYRDVLAGVTDQRRRRRLPWLEAPMEITDDAGKSGRKVRRDGSGQAV